MHWVDEVQSSPVVVLSLGPGSAAAASGSAGGASPSPSGALAVSSGAFCKHNVRNYNQADV